MNKHLDQDNSQEKGKDEVELTHPSNVPSVILREERRRPKANIYQISPTDDEAAAYLRYHNTKLRCEFTTFVHKNLMKDMIEGDAAKVQQNLYTERLALLQQGLIKRTLFVTGVQDVERDKQVRTKLKRFFTSNYKVQIESITKSKYRGGRSNKSNQQHYNMDKLIDANNPPPLHVRLKYERDIHKVLNIVKNDNGFLRCPKIGVFNYEHMKNIIRKEGKGNANDIYKRELLQLSNRDNSTERGSQKDSFPFTEMIHIVRAKYYRNVVEDLPESTTVMFHPIGMSLGHWTSKDYVTEQNNEGNSRSNANMMSGSSSNNGMGHQYQRTSSNASGTSNTTHGSFSGSTTPYDEVGEWLEAANLEISSCNNLNVLIDLNKRIFELSTPKNYDVNNKFIMSDATDFLTFRFKDIDGYIDFCCSENTEYDEGNHHISDDSILRYSLIFTLKSAPRLFSNNVRFGLGYMFAESEEIFTDRSRDLIFGGIHAHVFGAYTSYKFDMSLTDAENLIKQNSSALRTLESFGLFRSKLLNFENARLFNSINLQPFMANQNHNTMALNGYGRVQQRVESLHEYDNTLGFTFRSVMDQLKFSWYHLLNDFVVLGCDGDLNHHVGSTNQKRYDIFSLIRTFPKYVANEALLEMSKIHGETKFPCQLFHMLVDDTVEPPNTNSHCASIPRLLVSPCRQRCFFFETETSNRVIRTFVEEHNFRSESFLRVQFGEDSGMRLFPTELSDVIMDRMRSILVNGVEVNGVMYKFLAYSSSQLKECSVWMVRPENGWTVERMRNNMGNFNECNTASKYAARIGQCFSTTFQGLALEHALVNDILSSRKMNHSDGCGLISYSALSSLLEVLPYHTCRDIDIISVAQIRYGGAKGILVVWPDDVIQRISGNDESPAGVILRPSMVKFQAEYKCLEVCRLATQVPYYLNRNVILLLGTHKVKEEVFKKLQNQMIDELETMLEDRVVAIKVLSRLGGPDQAQRTRLLHVLHAGLSANTDPFLFSCCLSIRTHHLCKLRKKARIFVENGAVLIGGVDETGLLPEFCVFLQVRKCPKLCFESDESSAFEPITGPVMVTKHPVMHPGDVRMLLAIDIPELRGHKNVLLFSQHGTRPEPNKMAGSDLDGDEYAITWDPQLFLGEWNNAKKYSTDSYISKRGNSVSTSKAKESAKKLQNANAKPLDYNGAPTNQQLNAVGLVDHFINYAKNDNLGRIGNLWQDWAASEGADCSQCIELAAQHSIAVDFAKTGVPAYIPDTTRWYGPRAHWREKSDEPSYHCKTIIGQLYDDAILRDPRIFRRFDDAMAGRFLDRYGQVVALQVNDTKTCLMNIYQSTIPTKLGWLRETNEVQTRMEEFTSQQRLSYEKDIMQIMIKFNLRNEGELFTGCIRKFHRLHKKRQHEISEEIRRECREMCDKYRVFFFDEVVSIVDSSYGISPIGNSLDNDLGSMAIVDVSHNSDESTSLMQVQEWAVAVTLSDPEDSYSWLVRRTSRQMAASYYMATYSPFRHTDNSSLLFSFPWLVADVISAAFHEKSK